MKIKTAGLLSVSGLLLSAGGTILTLEILKPELFFPLKANTVVFKPQKFNSGKELYKDLNDDFAITGLRFDDVTECIDIYKEVSKDGNKDDIEQIFNSSDNQSHIYTLSNKAQKTLTSSELEGWYDVSKGFSHKSFLEKYDLNKLDLSDISYVIEVTKNLDKVSGNLLEIRSYQNTFVYSESIYRINHIHEVKN